MYVKLEEQQKTSLVYQIVETFQYWIKSFENNITYKLHEFNKSKNFKKEYMIFKKRNEVEVVVVFKKKDKNFENVLTNYASSALNCSESSFVSCYLSKPGLFIDLTKQLKQFEGPKKDFLIGLVDVKLKPEWFLDFVFSDKFDEIFDNTPLIIIDSNGKEIIWNYGLSIDQVLNLGFH